MVEEKFICPVCNFESNGPGLCPVCDENLQRVCNCGSGKFATECCTLDNQQSTNEERVAAEVKAEDMEDRLKDAEISEEETEKK